MAKKEDKQAEEPSFDSMVEGGNGVDEEQDRGETMSTGLATFSDSPSFTQEDVVIPQLRLAQGLTTEVQDGTARPGQWLLIGYEPEDDLTVVPVAFTKRRELRDDDTREILCLSRDSITGVGEPGGDCSQCPMQEWTDGERGERVPPPCTFMYTYLVYVVDLDAVAMMMFKSTALRTGKLLNTIVAQRGMGRCAIKLASNKRQGPSGNYYVPSVSPQNVEDEVLETAADKVSGDVVV